MIWIRDPNAGKSLSRILDPEVKKTASDSGSLTHWLPCVAGTGGADQLGAGGAAGGVSCEDVPHLHYPGVQPRPARAHSLLLQPGQAVHTTRPLQQDAGPGQSDYEIKGMKVLQRNLILHGMDLAFDDIVSFRPK